MKKLVLSACGLLLGLSMNAQMRFGIEAGLNISGQTVKDLPSNYSMSTTPGFRIGAIMDYAINDNFSIQPGIFFSMGGSKSTINDTISSSETLTLNYIHIPINAVYNFEVGSGKLFVAAGPYLAYGISGTDKVSIAGLDVSTSNVFGSDYAFKNLDFGIGINAGYELPMGIFLRAGYDYGMANILNTGTANNYAIHISAGYMFGGK